MNLQTDPRQQIEQQAMRCVQCALCLPHCPTFRLHGSESESPRGRIALARAIANGALNDAAAWRHLDNCIECGACTDMCPSNVDYRQLRRALHTLDTRPLPPRLRMIRILFLQPRHARLLAARLTWLFQALVKRTRLSGSPR